MTTTRATTTTDSAKATTLVKVAGLLDGAVQLLSSLRVRILGWFVLLLGVATLASVLVVRQVLLHRLDERIDRELVQETEELRRLAGGNDPETGAPFKGDVPRIFEVFLQRNIPTRHEMVFTFVRGEPYLRSSGAPPHRLDQDPDLVGRLHDLRQTDRGRVNTPVGAVDYLATPIRAGDRPYGVFVVAIFRDLEGRDSQAAGLAAGAVGAVMLLVGSFLAWRLAEHLLSRVRLATTAARSISERDLSLRVPVTGRDELAELGRTFNQMLDRLETGFAMQRRFIDDAGHEFRTPITILRGHLESLDDDRDERERTVALFTQELDQVSRMVGDLLTLTKSGRPDFLHLERIDVAELTEKLHEKVQVLADRRWLLEAVGKGDFTCDEQRLTQAVIQLANNAVRHTEEGSLIALGSETLDGGMRFWIRDAGPGIRPEEQHKVFERFYRGSGTGRSEGAGLGLSIVRAIAQAHGGKVELRSPPGEGATFTLVLPARGPYGGEPA